MQLTYVCEAAYVCMCVCKVLGARYHQPHLATLSFQTLRGITDWPAGRTLDGCASQALS